MNLSFFSKKQNIDNAYFALFLKEDEGVGFILENNNGQIKNIAQEKFKYSNGWENLTEDVDDLLFKLENQTKKHLKKTIFFVYAHLVDEKTKDIKVAYLSKIKALTKNLELEAMGYIECFEAVVSYLENKEQSPLTSIIVELDLQNLSLFIYKGGHKIFQQTSARTANIIDDFLAILETNREKIVLPSRIILYNSSNLSSVSSQIISYRWSPDFFIQLPRVEIINEENQYKSLINLFEKQVSKVGFQEKTVIEDKVQNKNEVMGFVIGQEIKKNESVELQKKKRINFKIDFLDILIKIKGFFKQNKIGGIVIGAIGLIVLLCSIISFEFFLHKADVTVLFSPYKIDKKINFSPELAVATLSADFEKAKTTTGKKKIGNNAQGEVTVFNYDDKEMTFVKGTVLDSKGIKFILDQEIKVASSSITTDGSAKLPGKIKAKITASEIGTESNLSSNQRFSIGDLSSSVYFAINESSFSGGSSKEVRTVSKEDIEAVKELLLKDAKIELQKKIKTKIAKDVRIIDENIKYSLNDVSSSKEIGEETDSVVVKAKVDVIYETYKVKDLILYLEESFKTKIPVDYIISEDSIVANIKDVENTKNKITLNLEVKIEAMKKINKEEVLKKIVGKNKVKAQEIIKQDFKASGLEMEIKPNLPFFNQNLPLIQKNIQLNISSL